MFFCFIAAAILSWLARVFVKFLISLLLLAAEGVFLIFQFSLPLAPFLAPLLYVIQLLSDVTVLPTITDTLIKPFFCNGYTSLRTKKFDSVFDIT